MYHSPLSRSHWGEPLSRIDNFPKFSIVFDINHESKYRRHMPLVYCQHIRARAYQSILERLRHSRLLSKDILRMAKTLANGRTTSQSISLSRDMEGRRILKLLGLPQVLESAGLFMEIRICRYTGHQSYGCWVIMCPVEIQQSMTALSSHTLLVLPGRECIRR